MNDVLAVSLISAAVSLAIAVLGIVAARFGRRDTTEDKSRDALEERVGKAEARAVAAETKAEETTGRLYTALESGRQALLKSDADCKALVQEQQKQLDAVRREINQLRDFMTAYMRAVRNNVDTAGQLKIREELDNAGMSWPQRS